MIVEVLTIGDELLRGEILDSNKSHLSERLREFDLHVRFHASVRDDPRDIEDALNRAGRRSDAVLISGGLGPTRDDITIEVLAAATGRKLALHQPSLDAMRAYFERFGRTMSPSNEKQAWFPEGAEVLPNPVGTAPGCMLETDAALFFCMPGVPRELYRMLDEQVLPRLRARLAPDAPVLRSTLLRTFGIGESTLEDALRDLARGEDVELGFRTTWPDNFLRATARGRGEAEAGRRLDELCEALSERLGSLVYGRDDQTMESVVGVLLRERGATLATAESCTGGLLAGRITAVPGSSSYFLGGIAAYANRVKQQLLGVPEALLQQHGAVSEPVAKAMAEGARERFGADYALATTGISGPGGGSEEKPVGTVCIGFASPAGTDVRRFLFPFDRERHRQITVQAALDRLRRELLGEAPLATGLSASAPSVPPAAHAKRSRS